MKKYFLATTLLALIYGAFLIIIFNKADALTGVARRKAVWAGYTTSAYTGNLGGLKGANDKCDADHSGSHWASVDEIMKLGPNYPWTQDVWALAIVAGAGEANQMDMYYEYYDPNPSWREILVSSGSVFKCSGFMSSSTTFNFSQTKVGLTGLTYNIDVYVNSHLYYLGNQYGTYLSASGALDWLKCNQTAYLACVK
jgi:hypothetical protein